MKRIDERELRDELVKLRAEHRELDDQIMLCVSRARTEHITIDL